MRDGTLYVPDDESITPHVQRLTDSAHHDRRPRRPVFAVTDAMKPIHSGNARRLSDAWWDRGVPFITTDDVLTGRFAAPAERLA